MFSTVENVKACSRSVLCMCSLPAVKTWKVTERHTLKRNPIIDSITIPKREITMLDSETVSTSSFLRDR